MTPEELEEYLRRQPFMAFRIHMNNGRTHEVRHPEMAIVTMDAVVVGVHEEGERYPRFTRTLALMNIDELEPLATAS
ncbi:MAG: hypothetical protein WD669_06775 [Pirellulales bacterium]